MVPASVVVLLARCTEGDSLLGTLAGPVISIPTGSAYIYLLCYDALRGNMVPALTLEATNGFLSTFCGQYSLVAY
jgi:hypothetical protein